MNLIADKKAVKQMAGERANYIGKAGARGSNDACGVFIEGFGICTGMTRAIAIKKMRTRMENPTQLEW